uniref:Uncharacterized protein n=1 Tax=Anopheles dirus TaxID=7168 RepID=A0A182NXU7_9DIPT
NKAPLRLQGLSARPRPCDVRSSCAADTRQILEALIICEHDRYTSGIDRPITYVPVVVAYGSVFAHQAVVVYG